MKQLSEYRVGRNFIRVDDEVKIAPSRPGKRDGFQARVTEIKADDQDNVIEVTVAGSRGIRTVRPERVQRIQQTKGGARVARVR